MRKTRRADVAPRRPARRAAADAPSPQRLAVDVSVDGIRAAVDTRGLASLAGHVLRAEKARDAMVSIAFVSSAHIARLNEQYLGHEGPTDVIAFALGGSGAPGLALGDVYICPAVARENARRFGVTVRDEIERLVVHGTLHVLGHDHSGADREQSPMWSRQERLLRSWRAKSA